MKSSKTLKEFLLQVSVLQKFKNTEQKITTSTTKEKVKSTPSTAYCL